MVLDETKGQKVLFFWKKCLPEYSGLEKTMELILIYTKDLSILERLAVLNMPG